MGCAKRAGWAGVATQDIWLWEKGEKWSSGLDGKVELRKQLFSFSFASHCFCLERKGSEVAQSCLTLCDPMDTRLLCPWDFLGKSIGVGCHFLLQEIFPTQGSNPGLPHCRQMLYCLSHQGSLTWRLDIRVVRCKLWPWGVREKGKLGLDFGLWLSGKGQDLKHYSNSDIIDFLLYSYAKCSANQNIIP